MASEAARLLDELMGKHRNAHPNDAPKESSWDDEDVCKYFLCGFCPYELFNNTRGDLGLCDKIHDEKLVDKYRKSTRFERQGYEEEMMRYLQTLLSDVERRIKRGHARLALNNAQGGMGGAADADREEQIELLNRRINDLLEEAEGLGCEGKVEEAQGIMKLCDQLKDERQELQNPPQQGIRRSIYEEDMAKRMEVCEVCGALLVAGDAQQRIDEHIMGKQHMGYARIRAYVEDRRRKRMAPIEEREARLKVEREEREKQREVEREERKKREEEREKERLERQKQREKEREERDKQREKEREERRAREKERDKERGGDRRRSRSHDRNKRSRSRDGRRGGGGGERRRSRSKDRRHRSRSADRNNRDRREKSREKDRSGRDDRKRSKERSSKSRDKDNSEKEKGHSSKDKDDKTGEDAMETGENGQESNMGDNGSGEHNDNQEMGDEGRNNEGEARQTDEVKY